MNTDNQHAESTKPTTLLTWFPGGAQGNTPEIENGDRFLVAVRVIDHKHSKPREYWDFHVIVADCDEHRMGWDNADGDTWGAWDWSDVEWFVRLDRVQLPVPK